MIFDDIDIEVLRENFNDETIDSLDEENTANILAYLIKDGVYYAKDFLLTSLGIFMIPYEEFVKKFERLKDKLGYNYIDILGQDISLIEKIYEN